LLTDRQTDKLRQKHNLLGGGNYPTVTDYESDFILTNNYT